VQPARQRKISYEKISGLESIQGKIAGGKVIRLYGLRNNPAIFLRFKFLNVVKKNLLVELKELK
jgi:hypothetical protein